MTVAVSGCWIRLLNSEPRTRRSTPNSPPARETAPHGRTPSASTRIAAGRARRPSLGQFAPIGPLALLLVAALEAGVGCGQRSRIGSLESFRRRARPIEHDLAKPFQPPAVAEIEKLISSSWTSNSFAHLLASFRRLSDAADSRRVAFFADAADRGASAFFPAVWRAFSAAARESDTPGRRRPDRAGRPLERLAHVGVVLRLEVLQQRPLQPPLARRRAARRPVSPLIGSKPV